MKLVTYAQGPGALPRLGVRVGHRVLDVEGGSRVDGEPLPSTLKGLLREGRGALSRVQALAKAAQVTAGRFSGAMVEERAIRFLPPVPDADRFVRVEARGANGASGIAASDRGIASVLGHNAKVSNAGAGTLACVPQLVFVVGRRAHQVANDDDITDFVTGVTLLLDMGGQECAMGPEMVTLDEIGDLHDVCVVCTVNGEERLRVNIRDQAWEVEEVLASLTRDAALEPGDMFSTGGLGSISASPALKTGDVVECAIEGVTALRTTLAAS